MAEDERGLPVAVSEVKRKWPTPYLLSVATTALLMVLGLFLLVSRSWEPEAASIIGTWVADVEYERGTRHAERFEFRLTGTEASGTASLRGVRRIIEQAHLEDDRISFQVRSRERIGNQQQERVHQYAAQLDGDVLSFSMRTVTGLGEPVVIEFDARRP